MNKNKVALVTGASSGIGFAIASLLQADGYKVYGASRSRRADSQYVHVETDVTQIESVQATVEKIKSAEGRIDLLVNNAGVVLIGATEESSDKQIRKLFDTNFFGAVQMTNHVLPIMRKQKSGRIINLSSVVGFVPAPFMSYYCASKHALEGFSESLDHEVRGLGIRSILIEPGFTKTSINTHALQADLVSKDFEVARKKILSLAEAGVNHASSPDEIARLVLDAARLRNPNVRYLGGKDSKMLAFIRRFAPQIVFDSGLRKQFQLNQP